MKWACFFLLACILGTQIANSINDAARDVAKAQKAGCRSKVML